MKPLGNKHANFQFVAAFGLGQQHLKTATNCSFKATHKHDTTEYNGFFIAESIVQNRTLVRTMKSLLFVDQRSSI